MTTVTRTNSSDPFGVFEPPGVSLSETEPLLSTTPSRTEITRKQHQHIPTPGKSTPNEFSLVSKWRKFTEGENWPNTDTPKYLIDETTGHLYWNEKKNTIRVKATLLAFGGVLTLGVISLIENTAIRIVRIVSGYHFWKKKPIEENTTRWEDLKNDLKRLALSPIALIGMELAAIYAIKHPLEGRKIFASCERIIATNHSFIAPCFQPFPDHHLFGSDPEKQGGW